MPTPFRPDAGVVFGLEADASNIVTGNNPAYTEADFLEIYPQFDSLIPAAVMTQFIGMATATVKQGRWFSYWPMGMANFIAHFATLWLQRRTADVTPTAQQVIGAAESRGLQSSKSVGDVSVGYDFSIMTKGIDGWGNFMATSYGLEYAQQARLLGKGGSYVR